MRPEAHRGRAPGASLPRLRKTEGSRTGGDQPQKSTVRESGATPMTDALCGLMNVGEYKHVVLGVISDALEACHALALLEGTGGDATTL